MTAKKTGGLARGFTLIEFVVVVGIVAILAVMAVPALMAIVPQAQLRGAARETANLLQRARQMAANTQKPVRLALDCRKTDDKKVCEVQLYSAVFNPDGTFDAKWAKIAMDGRVRAPDAPGRGMASTVTVKPAAGSAAVDQNPDDLFWAVFLPKGQLLASHKPLAMVFGSTRPRVASWELSVDPTGRPVLKGME